MNTLVALTSTAIDLRVPTKLSLDAPRLCCSLRILCDAWLQPFALTGSPQLQRLLLEPVQSCLSKLPLLQHTPESPSFPGVPAHRSLYSSHVLSDAWRKLRSTRGGISRLLRAL